MIGFNDARFSQAEAIFDAVVNLAPDERAAVLETQCGSDPELRAFVERLLRCDDNASVGVDSHLHFQPPANREPPFDIGRFHVARVIGTGGMGVVYLASDTRLDRAVAIKALPEHVANDPGRLERFQREAKVLASLNHPNIAAIYGFEVASDRQYLVLEHVEGEPLDARLKREPPSLLEAIDIAVQITEALEAAHEKGIIHRDLKPSNIMITSDGVVKVLDFGLAYVAESSASTLVSQQDNSPVPVSPEGARSPTIAGAVMGTAGYMSPEQARGKAVDKRADIFSFGCVLYEMLTGEPPFRGDSATELIAATLHEEVDMTRLPQNAPPVLRRLLNRCLVKDRKKRLRDIGDARLELELATSEDEWPQDELTKPRFNALTVVSGLLAISIIASLLAAIAWRTTPEPPPVTRVLLNVEPADRLRSHIGDDGLPEGRPSRTVIALSPDGRSLAFTAVQGERQQLYLRRLDRLGAVALRGTDGASAPFFSPNGRWIGFWANGALRRIPVAGGPPVTITETREVMSASWSDNDLIVFSRTLDRIWQVPASGGQPEPLTTLDSSEREVSHRFPQLLPGNQAVLFTVMYDMVPNWDETQIVVKSLLTGERTVLIEGGTDAQYFSSGHLLYVRHGALMAVPFDGKRLEVTGSPVGMIADLMQASNMGYAAFESGAGQFSVAESGDLVYVAGGPMADREFSLVWMDRAGNVEHLQAPRGYYIGPRISPDGERVAVAVYGARHADRNVWLHDLRRGSMAPLTTMGDSGGPVWTPDGTGVVFPAEGAWSGNIFWASADRQSLPQRLTTSEHRQMPCSFSPDGRILAYVQEGEIWVMSLDGDWEPQRVSQTHSFDAFPEFSPDGRWLAYATNESGRKEVYVQPWPGPGVSHQVSIDGGQGPVWRGDGKELYYHSAHSWPPPPGEPVRVMAVAITTEPDLEIGAPVQLFEGQFFPSSPIRSYDVTQDGERFLMVQTDTGPPEEVREIVLVQNWILELKDKVP